MPAKSSPPPPETLKQKSDRLLDAAIEKALPPPPTRDCGPETDRFESLAEKFYRETGMMAPGKDVPPMMGQPEYGVRWAAYMNWLAKERPHV